MYKCVEDNGFFCVGDKENEPTIPCASENDAENLAIFLNTQMNTIEGMTDYIANLEMDLLQVSRNVSHIVSKQYGFRTCKRFDYIHNEKEDVYELIDSHGEFGPWVSLIEVDMKYLIDFMNRLQFEKEDLQVELDHKEEENARIRGLPDIQLMHDLTQDISEINNIIGFFIDNDIEHECVEFESEAVKEILDRLLKVMEDYQ